MKKDCPAGVRRNAGAGQAPPAHGAPTNLCNEWRTPRNARRGRCPHRPGNAQSQNCTIFGENAKRPVGADASVRPWGNGKFTAMFRKSDCALCGESAASTPTNVERIRRGTFVFAGACCRADRVVRPYGCVPFRVGACRACRCVTTNYGLRHDLGKFTLCSCNSGIAAVYLVSIF